MLFRLRRHNARPLSVALMHNVLVDSHVWIFVCVTVCNVCVYAQHVNRTVRDYNRLVCIND